MAKKVKTIEVGASIFEENDRIAEENRQAYQKHKVYCVNIMGSPGSGKTSVLERTVKELEKHGYASAVIEGDIKGSLDGERLEKLGIPVVQINTGGACHLDANMVRKGLENLSLQKVDILFIENVGNLVCPAEFKLGEDINVIISSVPEGEEKPLKYPLMFKISRICLLNKTDLAVHADFKSDIFKEYLLSTAPSAEFIPISAKTGEGFRLWIDALRESLPLAKERRTVIVGLGDRMKGDDGAGCEVVQRLKGEVENPGIKIINAENAVENYTGVIEKFRPDRVFIVDAVDFGAGPGEAAVLDAEQIKETTSSTHTFSLPLIIEHLRSQTGAEFTVVGIQPETVQFSEGLSPAAEKGVRRAVEIIREKL